MREKKGNRCFALVNNNKKKWPLLLAGLDGNGPAPARRLPGDPQSARPDEGGAPAPAPEVGDGQATSAHQTEASGSRVVGDGHSNPRQIA